MRLSDLYRLVREGKPLPKKEEPKTQPFKTLKESVTIQGIGTVKDENNVDKEFEFSGEVTDIKTVRQIQNLVSHRGHFVKWFTDHGWDSIQTEKLVDNISKAIADKDTMKELIELHTVMQDSKEGYSRFIDTVKSPGKEITSIAKGDDTKVLAEHLIKEKEIATGVGRGEAFLTMFFGGSKSVQKGDIKIGNTLVEVKYGPTSGIGDSGTWIGNIKSLFEFLNKEGSIKHGIGATQEAKRFTAFTQLEKARDFLRAKSIDPKAATVSQLLSTLERLITNAVNTKDQEKVQELQQFLTSKSEAGIEIEKLITPSGYGYKMLTLKQLDSLLKNAAFLAQPTEEVSSKEISFRDAIGTVFKNNRGDLFKKYFNVLGVEPSTDVVNAIENILKSSFSEDERKDLILAYNIKLFMDSPHGRENNYSLLHINEDCTATFIPHADKTLEEWFETMKEHFPHPGYGSLRATGKGSAQFRGVSFGNSQ